ncbi:enoyl-CoA hydratase/isomerase family protein [Georgenia sp. H159]|uniref:enoyl-CoA hydratase/isomerase family protein n=1 Tax=Georgenia sp. H159 TaxID=3076115 RepID=UPI002D77754B|nr:enoyl-CoA hydratase/isomerase family protein [Georgenia sp. H159]
MSYSDTSDTDVLVRREGGLLHLTLNRPKVINALTAQMVATLEAALDDAAQDPSVQAVYLDGAGERGFCAGGDITMTVSAPREVLLAFWEHEYRLNLKISRFPKPYVAVMDGITMGGGIGVAAHANTRVVTERSRLALPEVRIGFIPDVGGSLLLARAPGELGAHLGLTAGDMNGADALLCGFADVYIASETLPRLRAALAADPGNASAVVQRFSEPAPASRLAEQREWIDACYSADTVEEIIARLQARPEPEAQRAAELIGQMSPTSVVTALAALRRARELDDLEAVLGMELRIGNHLIDTPDMKEGVRAQIVDKDRNPRWQPSTVGDVDTGWLDGTLQRT